MDEHPDEIGAEAVVTLVRRAGEPISPDLRRRIRSNIEGHLAGDLIVDTFDDVDADEAFAAVSAPARRSRRLLACAAAAVAIIGVGTIVAVSDRAATPPATSPATRPPPTQDVAPEPVVVSTDAPTGELSALKVGVLDDSGHGAVSEFLPDGRLLRWRPTERGAVVTLHSRWASVEKSAVLPKGIAVAGTGDQPMRDVGVGPGDVLYASYLTSVTPTGWYFDVVAYSFEQKPNELARWPSYRACSAHCGELELARDGVMIDDDGGVVPYVEPVTGEPNGDVLYYVLDSVQADYEPTGEPGDRDLKVTVSFGDQRWTAQITGAPLPDVSAGQFMELQPQRDGSVQGIVFGDSDGKYPFICCGCVLVVRWNSTVSTDRYCRASCTAPAAPASWRSAGTTDAARCWCGSSLRLWTSRRDRA